ncbi:MAG: hypothetical protein AAF242_05350 [Bacteroidota bacterium]
MRFKTLYLWLLCCFLFSQIAIYAQEIRENAKGEKIVVYTDGSWRYFNDQTIHPAGSFPVFSDTIGTLDNPTNLTEEIVRKLMNRKSQLALEANRLARMRILEAARERERLEREYQAVSASSPNSSATKRLQMRLDAAKTTEQEAQVEARLAQNELTETNKLTAKGNLLQAFVQKQKDRAAKIELKADQNAATFFDARFLTPQEFDYLGLEDQNNAYLNPPKSTCSLAFNGREEVTGRRRKDMPKKQLFTHTDDRLRYYMKDKEYLTCSGYLSTIDGGFRMLSLEFKFAYPNAREAYGFIEKGSMLTLSFLNGDFINLKSGTIANGSYNMETEILTYRVQYPIDQGQISYLKKNDLDRIKVYWSSGFEEYEVYDVAFFKHQAKCLAW